MTPAQRARRIRQAEARRAAITAELRALDIEMRPIEIEHSRSLGFSFPPLRGKMLIDVMDREDSRQARAA